MIGALAFVAFFLVGFAILYFAIPDNATSNPYRGDDE